MFNKIYGWDDLDLRVSLPNLQYFGALPDCFEHLESGRGLRLGGMRKFLLIWVISKLKLI